jgi:hypothetical protein
MPKAGKRPCTICRRWFRPNPRVGVRQHACGQPECQSARRQKTQASWRRRNPDYAIAYRIQQRAVTEQELRTVGNNTTRTGIFDVKLERAGELRLKNHMVRAIELIDCDLRDVVVGQRRRGVAAAGLNKRSGIADWSAMRSSTQSGARMETGALEIPARN